MMATATTTNHNDDQWQQWWHRQFHHLSSCLLYLLTASRCELYSPPIFFSFLLLSLVSDMALSIFMCSLFCVSSFQQCHMLLLLSCLCSSWPVVCHAACLLSLSRHASLPHVQHMLCLPLPASPPCFPYL